MTRSTNRSEHIILKKKPGNNKIDKSLRIKLMVCIQLLYCSDNFFKVRVEKEGGGHANKNFYTKPLIAVRLKL